MAGYVLAAGWLAPQAVVDEIERQQQEGGEVTRYLLSLEGRVLRGLLPKADPEVLLDRLAAHTTTTSTAGSP